MTGLIIVVWSLFEVLGWCARRSGAQDEFEANQAQRMVELSTRYDYRTNTFRQ